MRQISMFRTPMKLLGAIALLFAAALLGQPAFAQSTILNSKHDLSSGSTSSVKQSNTTEVCVFCHTPHGASSSAPLWNRGAAATGSFTLYTSASMDGTAIQPSAGSGLCLSCHDGATALDLLINAPGSGGYNAAGLSAGYTFTGAGAGNVMASGTIANIGADLGNDHPVGIPYCGGAVTGACKDPDFKTAALYKNGAVTADPTSSAPTTDNFWIDVVAGGTRTKGDLPLYVRNFAGTDYAGVECATCHEPHGSGNTMFLRMANASSNLCLACHNK